MPFEKHVAGTVPAATIFGELVMLEERLDWLTGKLPGSPLGVRLSAAAQGLEAAQEHVKMARSGKGHTDLHRVAAGLLLQFARTAAPVWSVSGLKLRRKIRRMNNDAESVTGGNRPIHEASSGAPAFFP